LTEAQGNEDIYSVGAVCKNLHIFLIQPRVKHHASQRNSLPKTTLRWFYLSSTTCKLRMQLGDVA